MNELPAHIRQLIIDCRTGKPSVQKLTELGKWIGEQNEEMFALAQQLGEQCKVKQSIFKRERDSHE